MISILRTVTVALLVHEISASCSCPEPKDVITHSHMDAVGSVARVYTKWPMNTISNTTTSYYMVQSFFWYKTDFGKGLLVTKASLDSSCSASSLVKNQNYILFGSIRDEEVPGYAGEIPVFTLDGCRPQKQSPTIVKAEWQALLSYSPAPSVAPTTAPSLHLDNRAADRSEPPNATPTNAPTKTPTTSPTTASPTVAPETFEFQVDASRLIPDSDVPFFQVAANRWQSVIAEGLPDFSQISLLKAPPSGCTYPSTIDDLYLCASYDLTASDGPGGFVGFSAPTYWRLPTYLPFAAAISMDSADVDSLKSRGIYSRVILHELGHVLGIGTQWQRSGLSGSFSEGCPYFGLKAVAEYKALTGCDQMPSEIDGGTGTHCQHWDEVCLGDELMTGFVGGRTQLSRISIAGLEDLGYTVNYANSDYLGPDDINPGCMCDDRRVMFEREHGAVTLLNHPSGHPHRKLSAAVHDMAMAKGAEILATQHQFFGDVASNSTDFEFAGDKVVTVLVMDGENLFGVIVKRDE